jgi:hypothetical protein
MMNLLRTARRGRLFLVTCLAAVAVLAGVVPAAAASARHSSTAASTGSRCSAGYLQSRLQVAGVTVDSATLNATGTFTAPGQPPITGLPAF